MDRQTFFSYVRRAPFGNKLTSSQIEGMTRILDLFPETVDPRHPSNVLAQVFHETGGRMVPVRETFALTDPGAISALEKAWKAGKLPWVKKPYWRRDAEGKAWFGRGDIQITHKDNYDRLGRRIGVDLVSEPGRALEPDISAKIAVIGMTEGLFTGKKLSDYFNDQVDNPVGARAIVNGKDKAKLVASYHQNFLDAIEAARKADETKARPADASPELAKPDNVEPSKSPSVWTAIVTFITGGGGLAFLGNINGPWALGAFALILVAGAIGAYLVLSGRVEIKRSGAPA